MKSNIIITGTTQGIGLGLAVYFLEKGFVVHGCSRSSLAKCEEFENYHHTFVDASRELEVLPWVRNIVKTFGRIDGLINNIGLVSGGLLSPMYSVSEYQKFFEAIQLTTGIMTAAVSKVMMRQRFGRIVNISSIMSALAAPGTLGYSSSKAAVEEMARVAGRELAEFNVLLNSVALPYVETESSKKFGDKWLQQMLDMQTVKKPLVIQDLGPMLEFLLSAQNTHISGQVINVGVAV